MRYEDYPRVAVFINEMRQFGFLVYSDSERDQHRVRLLNPLGETEVVLSLKDISGFVGVTFESSTPTRPEPCERLIFFDGGRQRKGWVWEVEKNGKVVLLVDYHEVFPAGRPRSEVKPEEIETRMEFTERWLEELVLLPVGAGFRKLSSEELDELLAKLLKDLGVETPKVPAQPTTGRNRNGGGMSLIEKGGGATELAAKAARGAERLRELMAKVAKTNKGA